MFPTYAEFGKDYKSYDERCLEVARKLGNAEAINFYENGLRIYNEMTENGRRSVTDMRHLKANNNAVVGSPSHRLLTDEEIEEKVRAQISVFEYAQRRRGPI